MRPCGACDGVGIVVFEQIVQGRHVLVAYRCNCPAGLRVSAKLLPAPVQNGQRHE